MHWINKSKIYNFLVDTKAKFALKGVQKTKRTRENGHRLDQLPDRVLGQVSEIFPKSCQMKIVYTRHVNRSGDLSGKTNFQLPTFLCYFIACLSMSS